MTELTTIIPLPGKQQKLRPQDRLWISDADLIRWLGIPEKKARRYLRLLDENNGRKSGFPQKNEFWDNMRYVPAVKEYLDRTNGLNIDASRPRRQVNVR